GDRRGARARRGSRSQAHELRRSSHQAQGRRGQHRRRGRAVRVHAVGVILMPRIIRTPEVPYDRQRVRLDGRNYVLTIGYNEREQRWYLSLADESDVPIATGIKLVANWSLLHPYRYDPRTSPGQITASDISGDGSPPTFFE